MKSAYWDEENDYQGEVEGGSVSYEGKKVKVKKRPKKPKKPLTTKQMEINY